MLMIMLRRMLTIMVMVIIMIVDYGDVAVVNDGYKIIDSI